MPLTRSDAPSLRLALEGLTARAGEILRRHWAFATLTLLGVALRVVVTITYRPALFFTGDSVVYLNNAADLAPGEARPAGYALFLKAILPLHELLLVPVVQHVLGVAIAIALYALMIRLGINRTLSVLAAAIVLFDPLQLVIEQHILSEPLFQALMVAGLVLLLWSPKPGLWACTGIGVLLAAATMTRTAGLVLVVPVLIYAAVRRFGWQRLAIIAGAFAIPLVGYALWFQAENGRFNLSNYTGRFLYGRVAPFADCANTSRDATQQALCPEGTPATRNPWPTWWVFGPPSPFGKEPLVGSPNIDQEALRFALTTVWQQPGTYARTVAADFLDYFAFPRATDANDDPIDIDFPFRIDKLTAYPVPEIDGWIKRAEGSDSARGTVVEPLARALDSWARHFYVPGPLFALALVLGVAGACVRPGKGTGDLRAASGLFAASAILLMVLPVASVVFDYRHMVPAFPLIGPAGAIGATVLWSRYRAWPRKTSAAKD